MKKKLLVFVLSAAMMASSLTGVSAFAASADSTAENDTRTAYTSAPAAASESDSVSSDSVETDSANSVSASTNSSAADSAVSVSTGESAGVVAATETPTPSATATPSATETPTPGAVGKDVGLTEGYYTISTALVQKSNSVNKYDEKYLNIAGASIDDFGNAEINEADGRESETFYVVPLGNEKYKILAFCSGKALAISGANTANFANVSQYTYNGSISQQWFIRYSADGSSYTIVSAANENYVLDVLAAQKTAGTNVQLYETNGTAAQSWRFYPVADPSSSAPATGAYTIMTSLDTSKVLDIAAGISNNGQNAQIYAYNGTRAQIYYVTSLGYGNLYTIINAGSHRSLDAAGNGKTNGTNVQQWQYNGTRAQIWKITRNTDDTYTITGAGSGLVLDVNCGSTANGANVQLYASNNTKAQKWNFVSASVPVPKSGMVNITCKGNPQYAIDIAGASIDNGGNAQIYTNNGTSAQRFSIIVNSDGTYTFKNVASGKVLDVASGSSSSGANVQQYDSNGTGAQKWKLIDTGDGDGSFYLQNVGSGLYLDIYAAQFNNGANAQQWVGNGSIAQKFYLDAPSFSSGWQRVNGNYRFFNDNGSVVANSFMDNGNYYVDSNGDAYTGWMKYGSYYFYYRGISGRANDSRPYLMSLFGTKLSKHNGITCPNCSYYLTVDRATPCTVTVYTKYPGTADWNLPVFAFLCSPGADYDNRQTDGGNRRTGGNSRWKELMGPSYGQYSTEALLWTQQAGSSSSSELGYYNNGEYFHSVACGEANDQNLDAATYNLLGTKQSHGCIRVNVRNAYWIYEFVSPPSDPNASNLYVGDYLAHPISRIAQPYMAAGQVVDPTDPKYTGNYEYTDSGVYYNSIAGFH